jgi:undecaprenyl-diphosphatase
MFSTVGAPAETPNDPRHGAAAWPDSGKRWTVTHAAGTLIVAYVTISLVLIGAGLVLVHLLAPVRSWDNHVNLWFAHHRTSAWNRVSKGGTFLANTMGVVVVGVLVTGFALLRRWGRSAALLACGLGLELAVFLTVNYIVARPRPTAPHLGPTPSTYSFPSGHIAATFVLYGGIAVLVTSRTSLRWARAIAWVVAVTVVGWVGFSRVYEAQHHPTDVFAGLCMGIAALGATVLAVRPAWPARTDTSEPVRGTAVLSLRRPGDDGPVHGERAESATARASVR